MALALLVPLLIPVVSLSQEPTVKPVGGRRILGPALAPAHALRAELAATSIRLHWSCVSGPIGYEVFATPTGGSQIKLTGTPIGPQCIQDVSLTQNDPRLPAPTTLATSFNHAGLAAGNEFTYVVRALYQTGYADSEPLTARTVAWPSPPGFAATIAGRTASLSWQALPGAPGYHVYRQLYGEPAFRRITTAPLTVTSFQDRDLPPAHEHRYYVEGVNGSPSTPASVLSGRPTNVSIQTYRGGTTVEFRWSGTTGAVTTLTQGPGPAGPFMDVTLLRKNPWFIDGMARDREASVGTPQYYKLRFAYPTGTTESDVLTATIPLPPKGITNLRATSPAPKTIRLTWTCDPEAIAYSLLRGTGSAPLEWLRPYGSQLPFRFPECEYTDTQLYNGTTYNYNVVPRYPDPNTSAGNAPVSATTPPAP